MTLIDSSIDTIGAKRCLSRVIATELTDSEIDMVAGSATITNITFLEWIDQDGDGFADGFRWEGDYEY